MDSADIDDADLTFEGRVRQRRVSELVYFAQAKQLGLIKIGVASDLARRLSNLRTGCPDDLVLLGIIRTEGPARAVEQQIHARFWGDRHHGEWFNPSADILDYIAKNAIGGKDDKDRERWANACICLGALDGRRLEIPYPEEWDDEPDEPAPMRPTAPVRATASKPVGRREVLAAYKAARGIA